MDVASAVVVPVVNVLTNHIKQKLGYLTSYAEHVEHMKNRMQFLEGRSADIERLKSQHSNMPARVPGWLEDVKMIKEDVDNLLSNNIGCFSVKKKFLAGRNALRLTKVIERLIKDGSDMISDGTLWHEAEGYLGRVDFKNPASTSTPGASVFNSRVKAFNDALKLLQQDDDDTARVIALCGMGGVGKTTLMKQLKKAATNKEMFNWIVDVAVGKSSNLSAIQNAIAAHIGKPLTKTVEKLEPTKTDEKLRADNLSKRFEELLEDKKKILVILDDVWEKIKLEDIGLASPLPKGVKLLLTSRHSNICQQIADDYALEVVKVDVLKENEAQDFFCQKAKISAERDHDLYEIGCHIVKKCGCLPLAIELIAGTLKGEKNRNVWVHTLNRLMIHDLDEEVQEIIEISYKNLKQEDKEIFLLCGLFPEDSNIQIEDLTRYAWGLELLKQFSTMGTARNSTLGTARNSTQASVSNLKNKYLLMDGDSDDYESVKMHDLVLAFVVNTVSKGGEDGCWIIHHEDDFSNWSESQSCKRISLTCKDMSKFPSDLRFPNLSLLKLMHGDESLRFPPGFYEGMEQLQVIAFEKLEYPLIPTPVQFSSNLRTLCLHECSLMFDLACIGNLSNLEVLSFANSGITFLPSTFGNLKKLRLLDVTGCCNLVIDDGVLKSLVKLEELYMRSCRTFEESFEGHEICFTDNNRSDLAECSKNLHALEFEFIGDNAHMNNMSYEKLQRFKLSVGCSFTEVRRMLISQFELCSYENSLKLVTNREEVLKSKINELFKFTYALYLQVNDMNSLEDVEIPHPPRKSSFYNLRILVVSECAELKYLLTPSVATNLSKLEYLDISGCPNMEAVIHIQNNRSEIIMFSDLKYLRLAELPKLLHFCNKVNVIELPRLMELRLEGLPNFTSIYPSSASSSESSNISRVQSFFHKEDATPKLEKLVVSDMANLKEIWPPQFSISNVCPLRELTVKYCAELKYLFTPNFATNLSELEYLQISSCDAMEAVIHTENKGSDIIMFSSLKCLRLARLQKLLCFCNNINVIELPRLMELQLEGLPKFTSIYHDSATSFVLSNISPAQSFLNKQDATPKLEKLFVKDCGSLEVLFNMDFGEIEQLSSNLRSIKVERCQSLVKLFSCNPFPFMNNLQELTVEGCGSIEVLFNMDFGEIEQLSSSLRSIKVSECDRLVKLFSCNPFPFLNNLQELDVKRCGSIEVIFDIDMGCVGEMDKVSSSRLRSITLWELGKLREVWRIKDAGNNLIHGFEAVESILIIYCERFENLITPATTNLDMRALKLFQIMGESNQDQEIDVVSISKVALPFSLLPTFHHLHTLCLDDYKAVEVVFEITTPSSRDSPHNTQQPPILPYLEELKLESMGRMSHVWKCNWNEFLLLQKPQSQSSFHNLTTIRMCRCNSIKYLFSPLMAKLLSHLKEVDIQICDAIEEVVSNRYDISSCDGIEEVVSNRDDEDASIYSPTTTTFFPHLDILDFFELKKLKCIGGSANGISADIHDQLKLSQASWSLCQYAREIRVRECDALSSVIPWYAVGQTQKLQVLDIMDCESMTEVFETQEINNESGTDTGKSLPRLEYITMLKLPKLKILNIRGCNLLKHIFPFSILESLTQLEELVVRDCKAMEVIVTEENGEQTTVSDVVVFPHLKSLTLFYLPNFVGFFLGKNEFIWPTLERVEIYECPQITVSGPITKL